MARKALVRHPDFTIVKRSDRGGYEGWYGGKAEAFRKNIDKVQAYFKKKYGQTGTYVKLADIAPVAAPVVVEAPAETVAEVVTEPVAE
jgi:hypothetical protein